MLAGDLGINLTVISDYHGAKDPDELIQKDPSLWQEAVKNKIPAVDWLLAKYEEHLDLREAPDKKQYSDVALKLLSYVKDEVERAAYEAKIAKKLEVDTSVLHEKGDRLNKKLEQSAHRKFLKKPKTTAVPDHIKKMGLSLLALKAFAGLPDLKIPLDLPSDSAEMDELELIFNRDHENIKDPYYQKEATELLSRYNKAIKQQKIKELNQKLAELDEDCEEYDSIIREITDLQKT